MRTDGQRRYMAAAAHDLGLGLGYGDNAFVDLSSRCRVVLDYSEHNR